MTLGPWLIAGGQRAALIAAAVVLGGCAAGSAATARALRVACVGDSITSGYAASSPAASYPAELQRVLGATATVGNFGHPGATLLATSDTPFRAQPELAAAERFIIDAPSGGTVVVVIMLGANDSAAPVWHGGEAAAAFVAGYAAMIDRFASLPTHPRIFVAPPLPVRPGNTFDLDPVVLQTELAPLISGVAAGHGATVISLDPARIEIGSDGVHPTDAGYRELAHQLRAGLGATGP